MVILLVVTAAIALLPVIKVDISTQARGVGRSVSAKRQKVWVFKTLGVKINFKTLAEEVPLPCIVHWNKQHFVVVYKILFPRFFQFFDFYI
ncbi:MAG: hypothetical protein LBT29_05195 [Flavobacteriaceae bacterium]|nr:hypothetical protein [Flavobacteriaceae bacterium]